MSNEIKDYVSSQLFSVQYAQTTTVPWAMQVSLMTFWTD